MNPFPFNRPAKSAARIAATLLGVLCLAAGGTYVYAASTKGSFTVSAPSTATVTQGQVVKITVSIVKQNGFAGPVSLSVSGVPASATASFAPNPVVVGQSPGDSSVLSIQTRSTTAAGSYPLTITASSGPIVRSTTTTLTVRAAQAPDFSLLATPGTQTVQQGDNTNFTVTASRVGGFNGAIALAATGLPTGATAAFSPTSMPASTGTGSSTLVITAGGSTPPGTYAVTIKGTAQINSSTVERKAQLTLVVAINSGFPISGGLTEALSPGRKSYLNLQLQNPGNSTLTVTGLSVTMQAETSKSGCSGTENFAVTQLAVNRYPLTLPANSTRTLADLGVPLEDRPAVAMLNLNRSQNACIGAIFQLAYNGSATR